MLSLGAFTLLLQCDTSQEFKTVQTINWSNAVAQSYLVNYLTMVYGWVCDRATLFGGEILKVCRATDGLQSVIVYLHGTAFWVWCS